MADTKNHVRESILKEDGSKDIYYKQNTAQDVLLHDGTDEDIRGHIVFYATCATDADVAAKEISLNDGTTDVLRGQAYVSVTFENGNTAEAITLSINGGTAYNVDGVTSTSIAAGNTVILIFDGSKFIVASGAGATKIKNVNITEGSTRYVGLVEGETDNGQVEYDDSIKITAEGLEAKVGNATVDFTPDAEQLNTDTRETNKLTSGLSLKDIVRKVWNIIAGLGSLAFRSSVGTAQLDTTLAEDYNLTVHKSGTINGAAVNDLYNGTDFSGDIGTKALDATVGATLQNSITTLNSKVDTNTSSISKFGAYEKTSYNIPSGTDLNTLIYSGIYMGYNLVNAPKGDNGWFHIEVIRHNDSYTVQKAYPFTNGTCPVYIRTQISGTWNGWRLFNPGTANTAQVLSGYTFSSANGVNLSGSMPSYTSGSQSITTSGKWGFDKTYGFWIYIPNNGYYQTAHWLQVPYATCSSALAKTIISSSGLAIYPAANGVTWSGTTSASATGANKSTVSTTQKAQTSTKVNLTDVSTINATFNGNCNPTASGSGSHNAMGSGNAWLWITSDGNTAVKQIQIFFDKGQSTKVATLDVSSITGNYFVHVQMTATGGYTSNTKPRYWYSTSTVSLSAVSVTST